MKINDLITMALKNLWRRKVRTFLTVLGVIIGATSIVVMMSLGLAQRKQMDEMINASSSLTAVRVMPTQWWDANSGQRMPNSGIITDKTIDEIKKIPHVVGVVSKLSLSDSGMTEVKVGKYQYMGQIVGMTPEAFRESGMKITEGKEFAEGRDVEIVVPEQIGYMLYDPKNSSKGMSFEEIKVDPFQERFVLTLGSKQQGANPLNPDAQGQKTKTVKPKVVGVYSAAGFGFNSDIITTMDNVKKLKDDFLKLTLSTEDYKKASKSKTVVYQDLTVNVDHVDNVSGVVTAVQDMKLGANSDADWIKQVQDSLNIAQAILAGIGSISLFVAAIGITNTMVMSIYERTKEIGVMKVIGASVRDIRNLFLLEAGFIGLFGGVLGVLLSYGLSNLLNSLMAGGGSPMGMGGSISIIPPWLALAALGFSFVIGVITGYYPAKRATKLSAIDAIRTE